MDLFRFQPAHISEASSKNIRLLIGLLIGCLSSGVGSHAAGQTFRTLHSFLGGSDGAKPYGRLTLSSNVLYGTTYWVGEPNGSGFAGGTVFSIHTDGSGFTNIHIFTSLQNGNTGADGTGPLVGLTLSGNTLYGGAVMGGSAANGTVFSLKTDGSDFTVLHNFANLSYPPGTNSDGSGPECELVLSGDTLYGTAVAGGSSGGGTAFSLKTGGSDFTILHNFASDIDGNSPNDGLTLSSNTIYGTTGYTGPRFGTVFSINTDGTGFTTLHSFTGGNDGSWPHAGLTLSGNTLYGTTTSGGNSGSGTVFSLQTDGTGFTVLYSFPATRTDSVGVHTNSDGATPNAGLLLSGNTLYGTTVAGGRSGNGTVFCLKTDGLGFTVLHSFAAGSPNSFQVYTNSEGNLPNAGLILSGNTLYGTAVGGGSSGNGTVFAISFTPQLTFIPAGANLILSWPTNYAGFDYTGYTLQSTTNLASAIWTTNLPAPVVVNGQYMVTNPISGKQQFFRLSQ